MSDYNDDYKETRLNADLSDVTPSSDIEILPPGYYQAFIRDSEIKVEETGEYVFNIWEIYQGIFQGSTLAERCYLNHYNPLAVTFGRMK